MGALRRGHGVLVATALLLTLGLLSASTASADVTFCKVAGEGAGQCASPSAVAVDQNTGIAYVADTGNNRVDAFKADGTFLWAFGLGVADGTSEALQTCTSPCKKGKVPSGFVPQDVGAPSSVAVDSSGAVYVFSKLAVRKFTIEDNGTPLDPSDDFAVFERLWGGGVVRSGASGTGDLTSGSTTIANVKTTAKRFLVGQPITGTGIPAETMIEALGNGTITLSKAAEASGTNVALSVSDGVGNVPSNEVQELAFASKTPSLKGPFKLTFSTPNPSPSNSTTASIKIEASGAEVQAALEALPNIDPGDVSVTGPGGALGEAGGPWKVTFGGKYADTDVEELLFTAQETSRVTTLVTGGAGPEVCTNANLSDCVAPLAGTGPGQFSSLEAGKTTSTAQLAARAGGGVVVADSFGKLATGVKGRVQRFDATGALVGESCPTGEAKQGSIQIAADGAGNVYVAGKGIVREFGSACSEVATLPFANVNALGTDEADDVLIADSFNDLTAIYEHDSAAAPIHTFYGNGTLKDQIISVAPYQGDLFVIEDSSPRRLARIEEEPPGPVVVPFAEEANPIGNVTTTLRGRVNPEGKSTTYHFQYVDDPHFQSEGGFNGPHTHTSSESGSIGSDFQAHDASLSINCPEPEVELEKKIEEGKCLEAETVYHFRVIATNSEGIEEGEGATFKTLRPVQLASLWSTAVGTDSARLHGEANPTSIPATISFEYVDEAKYLEDLGEGGDGFAEAIQTPELPLGSGSSFVERSALASSLKPDTTYRFRYIAHDLFGDFPSATRSFSTLPEGSTPKQCENEVFRLGLAANLPDCRAYELVSPLDKEGGDIRPPFEIFVAALGPIPDRLDQSTPQGDALTFTTYRGFGDAESVPFSSQYTARRDAAKESWATKSVNAPREGPSMVRLGGVIESMLSAFTEDLCSHWLLQDTDLALAPGAPVGVPNLYRRGDCGEEASYELLSEGQPPGFDKEAEGESKFRPELGAFNEDGSIAAFKAPAALTPEAVTVPVGEKLSCVTKAPPAGVKLTYGWLQNGKEIGGAKEKTEFTTRNADAGKAIQCMVSATGLGTGEIRVANPAQIVAPFPASAPPIAPARIPAPTASAPLTVGGGGGQTLSCDPNEAKWQNASGFAYQWYRNGAPILSGTASTYPVQAADLASAAVFQCAVTGENVEGMKATEVSEPLATNPATNPAPSNPDPRVLDVYRVYLHDASGLHLASVLPSGRPALTHASVGTALDEAGKRFFDSVAGALSADGSRLFWSAQEKEPSAPVHSIDGFVSNPSRLYLRVNPSQPQSAFAHGSALGVGKVEAGLNTITELKTTSTTSFEVGQTIRAQGIPFGTKITALTSSSLTLSASATAQASGATTQLEAFSECTEAEKACTLPISDGAAIFRAANPDATKAIYTEREEGSGGEKLFELDVAKAIAHEAGAATQIAGQVKGLMGMSRDLSRVYLVSSEDLDGAGPGTAGKFNLYLHEAGGGFAFVAALSGKGWAVEPVSNERPSADVRSISPFPVNRSSRVSPDGEHAAFMSESAALAEEVAGYDNTDAVSGEADAEVYLYDAKEGELRCVSCNPSGARPQGDLLDKLHDEAWAAASIRGWENQWYPTRLLSEDGKKLFFNSFEALVSRDTNGKQDVYEWERADSRKECEELGAERFAPASGGCLSLISSGKSPGESEFIDASGSGSDVFFSTDSSLVPQDYGLIDIYDARVGGGLPEPPLSSLGCEGENCQNPAPAPDYQTPASSLYEGPGNVVEKAKKQPCPKGKHLVKQGGKSRCVAKKGKKGHKGVSARKRSKQRSALRARGSWSK